MRRWSELNSIGNPFDRLQEWCDRNDVASVNVRWNSIYYCDITLGSGSTHTTYAANLRDAIEQSILKAETRLVSTLKDEKR